MPKIKIRNVYIKKLKELGVYDEWLSEVKRQFDIIGGMDNCGLNPKSKWHEEYLKCCYDNYNWEEFIVYSMSTSLTTLGWSYWDKIQRL